MSLVHYHRGEDIFQSDAQVLVIPVNCAGVMGKGLALEAKKRFPGNFEAYRAHCRQGLLWPGRLLYHVEDGKGLVNFPTKRHWTHPSRMEDIQKGLPSLRKLLEDVNAESVAIPALGVGLGGLPWISVEVAITDCFETSTMRVDIYHPH